MNFSYAVNSDSDDDDDDDVVAVHSPVSSSTPLSHQTGDF